MSPHPDAQEALFIKDWAIKSAINAIATFDMEGNLTYVNPAFLKLWGYDPRADVLGKPVAKFWQVGEKAGEVMEVVTRKGGWTGELIGRARDGTLFDVQAAYSLVVNNAGQPVCLQASFSDITRSKKAEIALWESEARFRELIDRMSSGVAVYEAVDNGGDFIFTDFNPAAERIEKISRADVLGMRVSSVLPGVKESGIIKVFQRVWETGQPEYFPEHLFESGQVNGSWRENRVFRLSTGEIVSIYNDITDLKKVENALRESEQIFSQFMALSPVLVYIKDEKLSFVKISEGFIELLDHPISELLGKNANDLFPPEFAQIITADDLKVLNEGKVITSEQKLKDKVYSTIKFPIHRGEKPDYLGGFSIDITARKKAEETLKIAYIAYAKEKELRQELEEEIKARIRFIDVLAHELKGSLTPMLASSGMIQENLTINSDPNLKKLADYFFNGTQILNNRLEELLDIARYARGAINLNLEPTDIGQFIKQVASHYTPAITRSKQELKVEVAENLPMVNLDQSRLGQVLANLLSNASKYSLEGGRILLTASQHEDKLLIAVKDEGIGISKEDQAILFQPYQRLGKEKTRIQGLGLGLMVVKHIVEAHGGQIWVTSEPGQGSTFSFTIPMK